MNTTNIILTIISSSVLASILTSLFNLRLQNLNYKKDYYKKLLDKRLDAYETLNNLTKELSTFVQFNDYVIHGFMCTEQFNTDFISKLDRTISKSFWLDNKTSEKLTELNVFLLNNVSNNIDEFLSTEKKKEKYQELGHIHFEEIRAYNNSLKLSIQKELKNLYKINDFFSQSNKKEKSFPVFKSNFKKKE